MFQLIPCRAVSHQYEVRTLCRGLQGQQAQQFGVGFFRCQPSHRNEKKLFRLQFKLGAQGDTRGVFGRGTKSVEVDAGGYDLYRAGDTVAVQQPTDFLGGS